MMNNKGKKFRLKFNPRFHQGVITESLGTLQINRPELKAFVDRINDDLNNRVFFKEKIDINKDKKYIQLITERTLSNAKYYITKYTDTGVDWIKNIDVVVIEDGVTKPHFENCEAYPDITKYDDYAIQSGCIIGYNISGISTQQNYKGAIYHELHHYFIELNRFVNTCLQLTDDEYYNDIFRDNIYYINNKNNDNVIHFVDYYDSQQYNDYINLIKSYSNRQLASEINKIFATMCYWLNNDEIECHLEEIFNIYVRYCKKYGYTVLKYSNKDLLHYSETLRTYVVIMRLLRDIEDIIKDNKSVNDIFNMLFGNVFYRIFKEPLKYDADDFLESNTKIQSIHKICNKFWSKMKRVSNHFSGMSVYVKNGFVY